MRTLQKKWSFPLRISSVNVTNSAFSCKFGHIYRRNPKCKSSFLVQWQCNVFCISFGIGRALHILTLREKCRNTELFIARIFMYWDWIFSPNRGKYGPGQLRIWKIFAQYGPSRLWPVFHNSIFYLIPPNINPLIQNSISIVYLIQTMNVTSVKFLLIHTIFATLPFC